MCIVSQKVEKCCSMMLSIMWGSVENNLLFNINNKCSGDKICSFNLVLFWSILGIFYYYSSY